MSSQQMKWFPAGATRGCWHTCTDVGVLPSMHTRCANGRQRLKSWSAGWWQQAQQQ